MSIEQAIGEMQEELDEFHQGTSVQPADGTADWFMLRALSLGMTYLQRVKQLNADPAAAERLQVACDKLFKLTDVPPPTVIVPETSTVAPAAGMFP